MMKVIDTGLKILVILDNLTNVVGCPQSREFLFATLCFSL